MRYLPTSRLTPGMALGQDIYDGAGRLLLGRHILLTEEQISNLEFLGFPGVYVDDEFSRGIEIQQIVSPEVRRQALKIVYDLFHTDMRKQEPSEAEFKLRKTVESVVDDVICNGDIMCNIMDIKSYDDYIYYHSIHVGILSVVVGARLGLPHDELCQLAAAALLHDIGLSIMTSCGEVRRTAAKKSRRSIGAIRRSVRNICARHADFPRMCMRESWSITSATTAKGIRLAKRAARFTCLPALSGLQTVMTQRFPRFRHRNHCRRRRR